MSSIDTGRATGYPNRLWRSLSGFAVTLMLLGTAVACGDEEEIPVSDEPTSPIQLVAPQLDGDTSVEEALANRRSVRDYTGEPLTGAEVSQLLWSAQGTTDPKGFRTTPSAGALYPLEVYVVVGDVDDLEPGVYRYGPDDHALVQVASGDRRADLAEAAVDQAWVQEAAIDLVFTAVPERTTAKYGERGIRYVHMEVGHAAQNVYLQAETLGLGVTVIGAFDDGKVHELVAALPDEEPLYIISIGRKA